MIYSNVLTQLDENRLVLFGNVGRQILTYNKREGSMKCVGKLMLLPNNNSRIYTDMSHWYIVK